MRAPPAQARWAKPIAVLHRRVEASKAAKAGGERDRRDAEIGFREQAFRRQQTRGLRDVDGARAKLRVHDAPQVAIRDAEFAGERFEPSLIERAGFDARIGLRRETRRGVDRRVPWRQLRAADETGAKTRGFRGRGRKVETAVFPFRRARRTDAAAIDARGFDADIEPAVEPAVLGFNGGVTDLDIKHRERI